MESAIIGTAGPAAHGKTALVRALTGQDATLAADDAQDGPTIDLGFAFHDIAGRRFGVVDLPGNERLVRGLLGDVHGMDLVLLVVAADQGVRPQTEECVDILHLLAARQVVFVITKIDLVDASRAAAVREDVLELARGTLFESAPIHAVSSVSGAGIDELRSDVVRNTRARPGADAEAWFRMPVDRSFTIAGRGLTVTGTPVAGTIRSGDVLAFRPGALTAEARTIQVHGETVAVARAGQRITVHLDKIERKFVRRGLVLADPRVEFATDRFDCWLEIRPAARTPLRSFDRVEVDIGTVETAGSVVVLDDGNQLAPRTSGFAQIALDKDVIVANGDRFVLRPAGGARTTGGGVVLHPFAMRHRSGEAGLVDRLTRLREPALAPRLLAFLELLPEFAAPLGYLAQGLNRTADDVRRTAGGIAEIIALPATTDPQAYTTRDKWDRLAAAVVEALDRFHRTHPLELGMDAEALRSRLRVPIPPRLLAAVVERLLAERTAVAEGTALRLPRHRVGAPLETVPAGRAHAGIEVNERVRAAIVGGGFTPPDLRQLETRLRIPPARLQQALAALQREGAIAPVDAELYYDVPALERARTLLTGFLAQNAEITVADYRTLLVASRKYALALLEHFDREGLTVRIGDARRLRG